VRDHGVERVRVWKVVSREEIRVVRVAVESMDCAEGVGMK
jgi:hypothetical protein